MADLTNANTEQEMGCSKFEVSKTTTKKVLLYYHEINSPCITFQENGTLPFKEHYIKLSCWM